MFKNILIPLDGSRFSSHALRYGIDIAQRYGARLILLRVVEPVTPVTVTSASIGLETATSAKIALEEATKQEQTNVKRARRYMSKKLHEVTSRGIKTAYYVASGDPFDSIMRFCKKEHVDLVVMTTHGKSGLKRAILGSVADKVVRDARVPALVIRPRQHKRK